MVRFGGSRLLVTREAGWGWFATLSHPVGQRCRASALGLSLWPSLTLGGSCIVSPHPTSVFTSLLFGASSCLMTTIFCSLGEGPSSSAGYSRPCCPLQSCFSPFSSSYAGGVSSLQAQCSVRPQGPCMCHPTAWNSTSQRTSCPSNFLKFNPSIIFSMTNNNDRVTTLKKKKKKSFIELYLFFKSFIEE